MSSLKHKILTSFDRGQEVLDEINVRRRNGEDYSQQGDVTKKIVDRIHQKRQEVVVSDIIVRNKDTKTFRLTSLNGYLTPFEPGQYLNIFVKTKNVLTSRPYSISSSPAQRSYYDITVQRVKDGFVSHYFLDEVKIGDKFTINGPAGSFTFNPVFHKKNLVFIGGGSGITPFISMLNYYLRQNDESLSFTLFYGARNRDTSLFLEELEHLSEIYKDRFHFELVLSEADENAKERKGFITKEVMKEVLGDKINNCTFYICGPQAMYDFIDKELKALEIPKRRIRNEMFGTRKDIQNEPGWPENIDPNKVFKLTVDGKTFDAPANQPLIVTLERNRLSVPVKCRCGECSMCRVKLVKGEVFIPRGAHIRHADAMYNYIHSCKAYPVSDIELKLETVITSRI